MKLPKAGTVRGSEKFCGQCKIWKPVDQFLAVRRGYRVTACGACARENMVRWSRTANVGIRPEDIESID